jgi:hypothetical protein
VPEVAAGLVDWTTPVFVLVMMNVLPDLERAWMT